MPSPHNLPWKAQPEIPSILHHQFEAIRQHKSLCRRVSFCLSPINLLQIFPRTQHWKQTTQHHWDGEKGNNYGSRKKYVCSIFNVSACTSIFHLHKFRKIVIIFSRHIFFFCSSGKNENCMEITKSRKEIPHE